MSENIKQKCNDCIEEAQFIYSIYPLKKYYLCCKCVLKWNEFKLLNDSYLLDIKNINNINIIKGQIYTI